MAHLVYDNFYLSNEVEDQYNSHLDLQPFCTVDNSLEGVPGMKRRINVYSATDGTQKLAMGEGNTKSIQVSYIDKEYEILLAQNKFEYYDEQAMIDPMLVPVGTRHMGTDLFNTVNGEIFAELNKATLSVSASKFDFDAFVDAQAKLNFENLENVSLFGFVSPADMASIRKNLKEDLKYILCHNNGLHTAEALPMIFSTLQNRGYEFIPIGQLIYKTNYSVDHTGKQHPAV